MRIGTHDTAARVLIVAEIGNNHEGDFDRARQLVLAAGRSGADAVKFQTARADLFISPGDADRLARFRSYEFSNDQWRTLADVARRETLAFLSTPLDLDSATMLEPLVDAFKIASGDITFVPLLRQVAATGKPLIVSTGASTVADIEAAIECVRTTWRSQGVKGDLALLHCVSAYPTPPGEANLAMIRTLSAFRDATIGYSDHVAGTEAAVVAVAAGARIIEKHFTLDKAQSSFRDHALSADPAEFRDMVTRIRHTEAMLGSGEKALQPCERAMVAAIRRSVAARHDLASGHLLTAGDLMWVRPGTGVAPGDQSQLIGRVLKRHVGCGELLGAADLAD